MPKIDGMFYSLRNFIILAVFWGWSGSCWAIVYDIFAYQSYNQAKSEKMELIGVVSAITKSVFSKQPRLLNYDTREMIISAKLYEHEGLRVGDIIYLIQKDPDHRRYKNGYIIGRAEVQTVFKTEFQGWMMQAVGNFSMIKKGNFIARLKDGDARNEALMLTKFGDKHRTLGEEAEAFSYYKKSLNLDQERPETMMRLANISREQNALHQSRNYINEAWIKKNRFTDANDALRLPGEFLEMEMQFADNQKICNIFPAQVENDKNKGAQKQELRKLLCLLQEIRGYTKILDLYYASFSKETMNMLKSKGLPEVKFQYQMGKMFFQLYDIADRNSINKERMLEWLSKKEREIFYHPIYLPYRQGKKFAEPMKVWSEAFLDASLYHFQLAFELDKLNTKAAYEIVKICYNKIADPRFKPTKIQRDVYAGMGYHFAVQFLKVPGKDAQMTFVRRAMNAFSESK